MSAYLSFRKNGNRIGMFDGRRWSLDLEIKISRECARILELLGEEFSAFFPSYEDAVEPMEPLMRQIPSLLAQVPAAIAACERSGAGSGDRLIILPFLKNPGPTLRRIQSESPTGKGWAVVAY